jgi:hemerythrin-like domain-containing protein
MAITSQPMLTPRSADDPEPDLTSLVVIHRAIRQDLARLATLLEAIAERDLAPGQARAVGRYIEELLAAVRAHLAHEDEIIWPVIAATARQAVDLTPLSDDHQAIAAACDRARHALASFVAGPATHSATLRASVSHLRDLLDEHIAEEEAQLFPAMRRYLAAPAYRWCEKQIMRQAAPPGLRFTMPWLARHAGDDELRPLLAAGGWRARMALAVTRPGYDRLERRAFGARQARA